MGKVKLYNELAEWWPLLSNPADYAEEAEIYRKAIIENSYQRPTTMLELGSGGGNNAFHLKRHFVLTLVDISPGMLGVSRELNPECAHIQGDMRYIRLGTVYDVVFIHDAICYMSTREHLAQAIKTAFIHCRPGGLALFVPDHTKESFKPSTSHGGHDKEIRGLRYLDWTVDSDPNDEIYSSYMVYLLKDNNGMKLSGLDEHIFGLFSKAQWLDIIHETGFQPLILPYDHSEYPRGLHSMFIGKKERDLKSDDDIDDEKDKDD